MAGIEIDVRDPQGAVKELESRGRKAGVARGSSAQFVGQQGLSVRAGLRAGAEARDELGYPLLFHPLDGEENIYGGKERLGNPLAVSANINNTCGFTFEHATTAAKFIITGTLDKFPKLEIVLPHSGGSFPYIAGRIERGLKAEEVQYQAAVPRIYPAIPLRHADLVSRNDAVSDCAGGSGSRGDRHGQLRGDGRGVSERAGGVDQFAARRIWI